MERWFKFRRVCKNGHLFFEIIYIYIYIYIYILPFLKNLASQSFGGTVGKLETPENWEKINID